MQVHSSPFGERLAHAQDTTYFSYSGLGAVLARERTDLSNASWEQEEFRVDALGNVLRTLAGNSGALPTMPDTAKLDKRGELIRRIGLANPDYPSEYSYLRQVFNFDGQQEFSQHYARDRFNTPYMDNPTRSYFGGDGKLRAIQRHFWAGGNGKGTWEEYRYDALGRRAMVVARPGGSRTPGCDLYDPYLPCAGLCTIGDCLSKVTYTVWDGDQIVSEDREPYPGGTWDTPYFGSVQYVHGAQLDQPLGVLDGNVNGGVRIPNPNWRGKFETSVTAAGVGADCTLTTGFCQKIAWPAGQAVYQQPAPIDMGGTYAYAWAGTMVTDGQDGTGQLFRRNRYFDPDGSRFTQEDPIGLAGGMNLYGFAAGDPVNFDDPFGLCPECETEEAVRTARENVRMIMTVAPGLAVIPGAGPILAATGLVIGVLVADRISSHDGSTIGMPASFAPADATAVVCDCLFEESGLPPTDWTDWSLDYPRLAVFVSAVEREPLFRDLLSRRVASSTVSLEEERMAETRRRSTKRAKNLLLDAFALSNAEEYCERNGTLLSRLVEDYLQALPVPWYDARSAIVQRLRGAAVIGSGAPGLDRYRDFVYAARIEGDIASLLL